MDNTILNRETLLRLDQTTIEQFLSRHGLLNMPAQVIPGILGVDNPIEKELRQLFSLIKYLDPEHGPVIFDSKGRLSLVKYNSSLRTAYSYFNYGSTHCTLRNTYNGRRLIKSEESLLNDIGQIVNSKTFNEKGDEIHNASISYNPETLLITDMTFVEKNKEKNISNFFYSDENLLERIEKSDGSKIVFKYEESTKADMLTIRGIDMRDNVERPISIPTYWKNKGVAP